MHKRVTILIAAASLTGCGEQSVSEPEPTKAPFLVPVENFDIGTASFRPTVVECRRGASQLRDSAWAALKKALNQSAEISSGDVGGAQFKDGNGWVVRLAYTYDGDSGSKLAATDILLVDRATCRSLLWIGS